MKKTLNIAPIIIFFIIIAFGAFSIHQKQQNQSLISDLDSGKKVELPDFSLPNLYDSKNQFTKSELLNNPSEITLINLFASWCVTCLAEHPQLLQLKNNPKIRIYGIAWNDIEENTVKYLQKEGNPYLKVAIDNKGMFSTLFDIKGIPETLVINRHGQVIHRYKGNIDDAFVNYIQQLAK
ncbi:MAG: redoxin family protein [Proteobacteria bacterium]|nr:redoxin family protein [Pseudomonadota bacterium]